MRADFTPGNRQFFYLAMAAIALITFYPLFTTGFATADDFLYYMAMRRGPTPADLERLANNSGRFYMYITGPFYFLPYLVDSPPVIKLFHHVPLILCFVFFAAIMAKVTGLRPAAWLFLLLFLLTLQVSKHTSLFVAYPFYFTFSLLLLLASYALLLRFLENLRTLTLLISALLFGAGLLFYETYIFFLVFVFLTVMMHHEKAEKGPVKRIAGKLMACIPFFTVGLVYIIVYLVFRAGHPSPYAGSAIAAGGISIASFFRVIGHLSFTSVPLSVFETSRALFSDKSELVGGHSPVVLQIIAGAHVEWLVKGLLAAYCGYRLLTGVPATGIRPVLKYSVAAVLLIFLPHVPLALTEKYTFYVEHGGMIGYVTTFFSFFGILLLLTVWIRFLAGLFDFNALLRNMLVFMFLAGLFVCSVLTDYSNNIIARDIRSANLRFYAIDELCRSGALSVIPPGTPVFGKSLWDNPSASAATVTEEGFDWQQYFKLRSGIDLEVERDEKSFRERASKSDIPAWYMGLKQAEKSEDVMVVMAEMAPVVPADSLLVPAAGRMLISYYSPCKSFTVTVRTTTRHPEGTRLPLRINHIREVVLAGETIRFNIFNTRKGEKATRFTLEFPGMDLNSVVISNLTDRSAPYFYL